LASRPGRIDQAIEVPLPDEIGRNKLVQLYGGACRLAMPSWAEAAQRTEGVSAAFIKELMRRIAQASVARDGGTSVESDDISEALDGMLFAGGKLNVKLLGGAQETVPDDYRIRCLRTETLTPPRGGGGASNLIQPLTGSR
jgi:hypothetical protein